MSLPSRGEKTALRRVLDEGHDEASVFKFPDTVVAEALLVFGHNKKIRTMAHSIVEKLGQAGCVAEVYVPLNPDGNSLVGDVYSPRVLVSHRDKEPTSASRIDAYTYMQLAP